jgi:hypothetical protein
MLEYIYFVKCPGCEDEHFHFFNEAKDFAMSCMSQKPIITQVEVNRNDFGECTDSCDLGTVWSWEDLMTDDEPAKCIFTKDDLKCCDVDRDPEFAALDNSLDSVPDNFRKPVPANMAIEDLVEEMEENEDTVECKWCDELFDKSECRYEVDLGWLCARCQAAIKSRGETLTFREGPVDEAWEHDPFDHHDPDYDENEAADALADMIDGAKDDMYDRALHSLDESSTPSEVVEFNYDGLSVTLQGPKRAADDWDEVEETVSYTLTKKKDDVATDIWENFITEEDAKDVDGGLETLEDDKAWNDFLNTHWDELIDKYYDKLLNYYRDDAVKEYEETHSLSEAMEPRDLVELEYPRLTVTLYGPKRDADTWDEVEHTDSHVFLVPKVEVATAIWENWITEEDVKDVEGGLETLEDDKTWEAFLETHFDDLFEKYNKQILEYFKKEATEDFRERAQEDSDLTRWANNSKPKSYLEELEESADYRARLSDCPECGFKESYDPETGICINCGFTI